MTADADKHHKAGVYRLQATKNVQVLHIEMTKLCVSTLWLKLNHKQHSLGQNTRSLNCTFPHKSMSVYPAGCNVSAGSLW